MACSKETMQTRPSDEEESTETESKEAKVLVACFSFTGISSAASELKSAYPDITWKTGERMNGKTAEQLKSWLEAGGLKVK